MNKVIVEKHFEGYKAFIDDETCRAKWGFGTSIYNAVGDLVISHQKTFNIKIEVLS